MVKQKIVSVAKKICKKEQHAPIFIVGKGKGLVPFVMSMGDDKEKDISAFIMEELCRKSDADFAVLITECWFVERPDGFVPENLTPSKCADRKEALHILVLFREGRNISYNIPIERVNGKVEFGKIRKGQQGLAGRFVFTW